MASKKKERELGIHDTMFKNAMRDPEILRDFLGKFLPRKFRPLLSEGEIRLGDTEAEGVRRSRRHFDLIAEVRGPKGEFRVQIIVEHKSTRDPESLFQILEYKVALWLRQRREKKALSPIIPILFYHGEKAWKGGRSFQGLWGFPEEFRTVCANFSPVFVDCVRSTEEELLSGEITLKTGLFLMAMKYARDRDRLEATLRRLLEGTRGDELLDSESVFLFDMVDYYEQLYFAEQNLRFEEIVESLLGKERIVTALERA